MKEIKVGVIGFGTVGAGVAECLLKNGEAITKRTGITLTLTKIADIDLETDRGVAIPDGVLTNDAHALIDEVDIVVELVGGTTIAKDFMLEALGKGKSVVTANKALLADHGEEIFAAAEKTGADVYYEASVAGGIPIIKSLREGLVGNRIERMYGILNGTCNYILTRMEREQVDFEPVLVDAQRLGYAEAEPSLDVDGFDTAHKAVILASLAYGKWFGMDEVSVEGIRDITLSDLQYADQLGYRIKLLAIIKEENGDVQVRVHPALVPLESLVAQIGGVFNCVMVTGDTVDDTLFQGRGAGREATASAVVGDIVDVALNIVSGCTQRIAPFREGAQFDRLLSMDEIETRYYLRMQVEDKPGVIASISSILGNNGISVSSIIQPEGQESESVSMLILTHTAVEKSVKKAIAEIENLSVVRDDVMLIRIEDV